MVPSTAKTIKLFNRYTLNRSPIPEYPRNVVDEFLRVNPDIVLSDDAKDIFCDWIYTGSCDRLYDIAIEIYATTKNTSWKCRKLLRELLINKYGFNRVMSYVYIEANYYGLKRTYHFNTNDAIMKLGGDMLKRLMEEDKRMVTRQISLD